MARKKYLRVKDMPIFVADREVGRKYVLPEFAARDEHFLRCLANARGVLYVIDGLDYRYDLVETPRSRRNPAQTIPAGILAQLLGFVPIVDLEKLPALPTIEEAQAWLDEAPEPDVPLFRKKTPEQIIAEVKDQRRIQAREVSEDSLRALCVWLDGHFRFVSTIRN